MVYGGSTGRVLGLATTATRNSHFSALGVRGYPKFFDFFVGGSPEILKFFVFFPARLSGGRSFPALGPPRSGPRPPLSCERENPKFVKI